MARRLLLIKTRSSRSTGTDERLRSVTRGQIREEASAEQSSATEREERVRGTRKRTVEEERRVGKTAFADPSERRSEAPRHFGSDGFQLNRRAEDRLPEPSSARLFYFCTAKLNTCSEIAHPRFYLTPHFLLASRLLDQRFLDFFPGRFFLLYRLLLNRSAGLPALPIDA